MQIKYLGPSEAVNVASYGSHRKGDVKEYPDDFAEELLRTSKKQQFEVMGERSKPEPEPEPEPENEIKSEPEPESQKVVSIKNKSRKKGKK